MSIIGGGGTDPNKILPITYPWAREHYKNGVANNWVPSEVSMQADIELWRSPNGLSEAERHLIMRNMGFFSTAESLTANNLVLAIYQHITNPEARQYLLRQAYEEAIHTETFIYCCDSLGLDPEEVYTMYQSIPSIKAKDDFVVDSTGYLLRTQEAGLDMVGLLDDLIAFYLIMEGIFFYAGFVMMLSFGRRNKMVGVAQQFAYILRDESVHLAFGVDLINTIVQENRALWTPEIKQGALQHVQEAVELETAYVVDCLPEGVLGLNQKSVIQYIQYIADRRLASIHLPTLYSVDNPFPWMSAMTDLPRESNFFESRVTDYQHRGGLKW